jgi:hypothetical protein
MSEGKTLITLESYKKRVEAAGTQQVDYGAW